MSTMTDPLVQLTDGRLRLTADTEHISFRGLDFSLAAIDRVAYSRWIHRLNGAYMGTQHLLKLSQPGQTGQVLLDSKSTDERLEDLSTAWHGVVALLETRVCPRLVERITTSVVGGEPHRFGGIVAGPEGVRARRPLARTIPWSEVTGTEVHPVGQLRVTVRRPGGGERTRLLAGLDHWDVVLLPHVVDRLASPDGRR